jgi:hypothetical protein
LDPKCKSSDIMFSCTSCEQGAAIVYEYDRISFLPMLVKFYHHLCPLSQCRGDVVNGQNGGDYNVDFFVTEHNTMSQL